jgi:hypothetical protein
MATNAAAAARFGHDGAADLEHLPAGAANSVRVAALAARLASSCTLLLQKSSLKRVANPVTERLAERLDARLDAQPEFEDALVQAAKESLYPLFADSMRPAAGTVPWEGYEDVGGGGWEGDDVGRGGVDDAVGAIAEDCEAVARRTMLLSGREASLLREGNLCFFDGCEVTACVMCSCRSTATLLCAAHDRGTHRDVQCPCRCVLTQPEEDGFAPVLVELAPDTFVDPTKVTTGLAAVRPEALVTLPRSLPLLPDTACPSCGSGCVEVVDLEARQHLVHSLLRAYYAARPKRVRCVAKRRNESGAVVRCGREWDLYYRAGESSCHLGRGVTPLTSLRLTSVVSEEVLRHYRLQQQHAAGGQAAEELARILAASSGHTPNPPALRALLRADGVLQDQTLPVLGGVLAYPCFACGDKVRRSGNDACLKTDKDKRKDDATAPNVAVDGGVFVPVSVVEATLRATPSDCAKDDGPEGGRCGDATWSAASARAPRYAKKDITGQHVEACAHQAGQVVIPLCTGEMHLYHIQALILTAILGGECSADEQLSLLDDIACKVIGHIETQTKINPGWADHIVRALLTHFGVPDAENACVRFGLRALSPGMIVSVYIGPYEEIMEERKRRAAADTVRAAATPADAHAAAAAAWALAGAGGGGSGGEDAETAAAAAARLPRLDPGPAADDVRSGDRHVVLEAGGGAAPVVEDDLPADAVAEGERGGGSEQLPCGVWARVRAVLRCRRVVVSDVLLAVPLVHEPGHNCQDHLGGSRAPGIGVAGEANEQFNANAGLRLYAPRARSMTRPTWMLYWEGVVARYNAGRTLVLPAYLLRAVLKCRRAFAVSIERLELKRTELLRVRPGLDLGDDAMQRKAAARAHACQQAGVVGVSARVRASKANRHIVRLLARAVLQAALDAAAALGPTADAAQRDHVVSAMVHASADVTATARTAHIAVTTVATAQELLGKLEARAAGHGVADVLNDAGAEVVEQFKTLHHLAAEQRAALNAITAGSISGNDVRVSTARKCLADNRAAADILLRGLPSLISLTCEPPLTAWLATFKDHGGPVGAPPFPTGDAIARGDVLPRCLGPLCFVEVGSDTTDFEDLHQRVARLREKHAWLLKEVAAAHNNVRGVCSELLAQLAALRSDEPDVARGSGRGHLAVCGQPPGGERLVGGVDVAALDMPDVRLLAAGMAAHVLDGWKTMSKLAAQLRRLGDGVALLPAAGGAPDRCDGMHRSWLSRKGAALLDGTLSPATWAALANVAAAPVHMGGGAGEEEPDDDGADFDELLDAADRLIRAQRLCFADEVGLAQAGADAEPDETHAADLVAAGTEDHDDVACVARA